MDMFRESVNINYPLYKSIQGKYFVGQTELLAFGQGTYAWGGLLNPICADTKLYVSFASISNFTDYPITAAFWFNANPPEAGGNSARISPANTSLCPVPRNQVKIRCGQFVCEPPSGGVHVFDRVVPPHSTLAMDKDGKFIFGPGGSFLIFLKAHDCQKLAEARIAFGWWEDC